jgi:hypothetical protein
MPLKKGRQVLSPRARTRRGDVSKLFRSHNGFPYRRALLKNSLVRFDVVIAVCSRITSVVSQFVACSASNL